LKVRLERHGVGLHRGDDVSHLLDAARGDMRCADDEEAATVALKARDVR
jgi:hypothetical protein